MLSKNKRNKKAMLITGVSGLLGNNLAYYFKDKYRILGLYNLHPVFIDDVQVQRCDITVKKDLDSIIGEINLDTVIHCASLTNVDFCEENKKLAEKINIFGTRMITESLKNSNAKLIYISTDSVFDGVKGNFSEIDSVNPLNFYGLSKYKGEQEILKRPNSLILRTNLFGWNIQSKYSLAEWILNELSNNREIKGFKDAYFSSIYTFELARILDMVIDKNLVGIYNCGSSTSLSKYDFAVCLANRFNLKKSLIKPISIDDFDFKARRGKSLALDVNKLENVLTHSLPTIIESIEAFYKDFEKGLPKKIKQNNLFIKIPLQSNFIPYGKQSIDEDDIRAIVEVLRSERITQGPKVKEFEDALCKYTGAKYAVAVSSGTAALHIACLAAGVNIGDEVITSPITFIASANCILYCGGKPVFADIQDDAINIDPQEIKKKISKKTKTIIPVHFAGHPCDLEEIHEIAKKHNLIVIEDAAHALGAEYKGLKIGSCRYSDMAIFSFHPIKSITTGEGGAVMTNRKDLYEKLLLFRNHGITKDDDRMTRNDGPWYYEMQELGFNYRITDFQCALGLSQLEKLDKFLNQRREIVNIYNQELSKLDEVILPKEKPFRKSSWHIYYIRLQNSSDRKTTFVKLQKLGIGTQVHYIPAYKHPYYRKLFGQQESKYPVSEIYYKQTLTLPIYPGLRHSQLKYIIKTLKKIIK